VNKLREFFEVCGFVVAYEFKGAVVHEVHHLVGVGDNGFTIAPGDGGGEETGYFDVFLASETMGNGYGVEGDEVGAIEKEDFLVEESADVLEGFLHNVPLCEAIANLVSQGYGKVKQCFAKGGSNIYLAHLCFTLARLCDTKQTAHVRNPSAALGDRTT
jgi:hypothetical protein